MTTTTSPPSLFSLPQHIVLDGISWQAYEALLHDLGNRPIRLTYDNGVLEMMAPLMEHENWRKSLAHMIETMSLELEIEIQPTGSTTFRREDLAKALEPDECYYVEHAADIRGKKEVDLSIDPPPDLAIEVDITASSVAREPIYAALGIPELWRFHNRLVVLRLQPDGKYAVASASGVFPFLPMDKFEAFLLRMGREKQIPVLKEFCAWLRTL